jgi:hypothetical protein
MLAHKWGIKTLYYSLINKKGVKVEDEFETLPIEDIGEEEHCETCIL